MIAWRNPNEYQNKRAQKRQSLKTQKARHFETHLDTEYDRAKVPPYNGNDPPPAPGNLKALLFPPLLNEVQNKGTQGVQAMYGAGGEMGLRNPLFFAFGVYDPKIREDGFATKTPLPTFASQMWLVGQQSCGHRRDADQYSSVAFTKKRR